MIKPDNKTQLETTASQSRSGDQPPQTLAEKFIEQHDEQKNCPLFCVLPNEIRNRIFALVLRDYYDKRRGPYHPAGHVTRPYYRYPLRMDTSILRTCRLVYIEAHHLPILNHEFTFWCYFGPGREDQSKGYEEMPSMVLNRLSKEHQSSIEVIHIIAELHFLSSYSTYKSGGHLVDLFRNPVFQPRCLKITVRHCDWWVQDKNGPLKFDREWIDHLKYVQRLEEVVLLLESIERDKDQLLSIARDVQSWTFEGSGGRTFHPADPIPPYQWNGPTILLRRVQYNKKRQMWEDIDQNERRLMRSRRIPRAKDNVGLVYWVATVKWTASAEQGHSEITVNNSPP